MRFNHQMAQLFIPDGVEETRALARTTDLCIAAHQDDIEIMAFAPAAQCYGKEDRWFTGVVVTDGAGSPRNGIYEDYTDEEMKQVRVVEQKNAAAVGGYGAQFLLAYPSAQVKDTSETKVVSELIDIIRACRPQRLFVHNLADKHDTHVAVALRAIAAVRALSPEERPEKIYAMEVWRGLDWVCDTDKVCFDTSSHPNLAAALLGVFDSQIAGGKRYDLAAVGRRLANATFFASHDTDQCDSLSYGLDITQPVYGGQDMSAVMMEYIENFRAEIEDRIGRFS